MFRKKIVVPESNGEELEAVQLWSVEWQGRIGESSFDKTREAEFFTNEEDAKKSVYLKILPWLSAKFRAYCLIKTTRLNRTPPMTDTRIDEQLVKKCLYIFERELGDRLGFDPIVQGADFIASMIKALKFYESAYHHSAEAEGLRTDLSQLIRVALTNPGDIRGFIKVNYPNEYAHYAAEQGSTDKALLPRLVEVREALEFCDNAIYGEFCTGQNSDGSPRIALDGYERVPKALATLNEIINEMEKV